ncbi:hypothetical protein L7F22_062656 [Adiantum nelumboides]|nr:hypothetical protein [Adiantum nelumboides]
MSRTTIWTSSMNQVQLAHSHSGRAVSDSLSITQTCIPCSVNYDVDSLSNALNIEEAVDAGFGAKTRIFNLLSRPASLKKEICSILSEQIPLCTTECECGNVKHSIDGRNSGSDEGRHNDSPNQHCMLPTACLDSSKPDSPLKRSTHAVKFENPLQNVTSNSTVNGLLMKASLGEHITSSANVSTDCNGSLNSAHQPTCEDSAKPPPTVQVLESRKSVDLLWHWPSEKEHFVWSQCKAQTISIFVSFILLLVFIVKGYWMTGRSTLVFIFPWVATSVFVMLLLGALLLNFVQSQALCSYFSPLLFMSAFLSWLVPGFFLDSNADDGFFASMGLLVSISLPWLLSAAPIMAWPATLLLSFVMPFLFLATVSARTEAINFSIDFRAIFPIVVLITATNLLLWHLRSAESSKLLHLIDTWAIAFLDSKDHADKVHTTREEGEKDNADRISKMRQFISYVFHEIRVPFNAVMLGIGHLLASDITEEQHEILNMMDLSSASMIRILNDVLDMGKIEAGKLQLEKQPFNMRDMVSSLIWAFKDTMDSKGIEFSLCIDPSTKQLLSSYDLLGDKHRVRQVVANYLSNAAKFTPRGGSVTLRIVCTSTSSINSLSGDGTLVEETEIFTRRLGLSKSGKGMSVKTTDKVVSITVFVEDTGIGISKEDQENLFEPYIQISASSSQGSGGTGLGLSFAKRIVELAGGKIGVFSEIGKGSTFEFTMPFQLVEYVKDNDCEQMQKSSADMRKICSVFRCPPADPLTNKPRVLVVEDNLLNRKIIRKLLESFNLESDDVENGKQAVELVSGGKSYDMILVDKEMPVMDGHEATRQLRAMGVKSPIIGLTGNALNSDRNEFISAGVDDFFTKPISRHQLVKLLEAYGLIPKVKEKLHVPTSMIQSSESM